MKQVIRYGVFETNSSSTHSITIQSSNSKPKKPEYCSFIFQSETVKDNFDKLTFIIASNQFELSQIKLMAIRQIFWKVDFIDNEEGYITNEYYDAFDELLKYEKVTKELFEEHFGKISNYTSSYKNYSPSLKLLINHDKEAYTKTKKELDLSKFKSLKCTGIYISPYLINDINDSIKEYKKQFELYSLIIDTYCNFTGEDKEKTIEALRIVHEKNCYDDNFYSYTPLCTKFFQHGDLCNECIDCDCCMEDIIKYITPNKLNFKIKQDKELFNSYAKQKTLNIFKDTMSIHYFEHL